MSKHPISANEGNEYDHLFGPDIETNTQDSQRPGEVAAIRTQHSSAIGNLASRNLHPDVRQDIKWVAPETGLQKRLSGVHLGAKKTSDGRINGYKDQSVTPVTEAGLFFIVSQASHGFTGIDAKPMPGYKIEAAELDSNTGEISWVKPYEDQGEVRVASDRGNLMKTPFSELATTNLGNPGAQAGVVRVTGPDNETKYYALGAQFDGEPDNWQVEGGIIEVNPEVSRALNGSVSELPPAIS